ncbi:putative phospholipid-transporting ATPase [Babesia gibsoni]|uniref:Phospholipid-transporting ATPase n=1 Tax=Babesia gibsoni TaxID=33632 RepID=A0AAD8PF50_BABGI|nr:putative phospholipid-transporting ATPase [Babesia gibsoni]
MEHKCEQKQPPKDGSRGKGHSGGTEKKGRHGHSSRHRKSAGNANKDELITKRQNLCFGAKLQQEWESRSLKINPILDDDVHRFVGNHQHTYKWALTKHIVMIILANLRRLPYVWGAAMIILQLMTRSIIKKGAPKASYFGNLAILIFSFSVSVMTAVLGNVKLYFLGRCIDFKRCYVLQPRVGRLKRVKVCDLVVGNIVKLTNDEAVPADMILLACSNPDGKVYVDTSMIDGKGHLKVKCCTKETRVETSIHAFANIRGQITCDRPSPDMGTFSGTLRLTGHPRPRNVHVENFVMKGSIIRNTGTVYGVITHTGPDTKIAQNIKQGNRCLKPLGTTESIINMFTVVAACIYMLCLIVSMGTKWSLLLDTYREKKGASLVIESLLFVVIRFLGIYGGIVPVTLPAIVDVIRYIFGKYYDGHGDYSFISENADDNLQKSQPDPATESVTPISWPLNPGLMEELGLVDIVFCDKTGTLTSNELKAYLIIAGDDIYNVSEDKLKHYLDNEGVSKNERLDRLLKLMCLCNASASINVPNHLESFISPLRLITTGSSSFKRLESKASDASFGMSPNIQHALGPSKSKIHFGNVSYIEPMPSLDFALKGLDVSQSYTNFNVDNVAGDSDEMYTSSIFTNRSTRFHYTVHYKSPFKEDECMMDTAHYLGYRLTHRSVHSIHMDVRGHMQSWSVIGFNDFSHTRRRMSIVLKREGDEGSVVLVKGSGETMLSLLKATTEEENREIDKLVVKLQKFASAGLRVIVCAYRELSDDETTTYQRHFSNAEDMVYSADTLHEEAAIMVERRLTYLGLAVMKDEIQPGVTETLELLMEAGVRVWMTTGDNRYAALEAAFLSKLLVNPCKLFDCKLPENKVDEELLKYGVGLYDSFLLQRGDKGSCEQLCLVLDGTDLKEFLRISELQTYLVNMLCFADVVVACNLTPTLKAEMVKQVKTRLTPTPITLAIGDGMNDVRMMQEAHIGVAVTGSFPDAVSYADFAITHFAGLRTLLFYQGSSCLQAIASAVCWGFFKNLCLIMPVFYYQGSTNWAGLGLYGSFVFLIFNLVFTTLPVIICSLFDCPLSESVLTNIPVLYTLCRRRFHMNLLKFGFWILEGLFSSIVCYVSIQGGVLESPMHIGGGTLSAKAFGIVCSIAVMEMSNVRLLLEALTRNNIIGIITTMIFIIVSPPTFLCVCYFFGGNAVSSGAAHVALWPAMYFLLPIWISTTTLFFVLSTLVQALLSPNMGNYLKHWLPMQSCSCGQHNVEAKECAETGKTKKQSIWNRRQVYAWCRNLLRIARKEFNFSGVESLARMIPAARPFVVREGEVTSTYHNIITASASFAKDNVEDDELSKKDEEDTKSNDRASYIIDRVTLRFKDNQLESDYTRDKKRNHYRMNRIWYRMIFITLGVFYTISWILDSYLKSVWKMETKMYSLIPSLFVTLFSFGCAFLTFHPVHFVNHINKALHGMVFFMILHHVITMSIMEPLSSLQPILFPIFSFVILNITFIHAFVANIIFSIVTLRHMESSVHSMPLFLGINVFVAFVGYRLEYNNRKHFLFEYSARNARKKQYELLNTMLPNFVVSKMINARLNEDGIPIDFEAEEHACVSVLFCDVYQFQNLVATVEPTILVELLDSLFLAFDRCAEQFGATKIETVFETYLAALGLARGNIPCPYESAASAIDMALAMVEAARQVRYPSLVETEPGTLVEHHESLPVKIGINSGKVISGLVGAKKPQYALFGDTVNTASRMKTTGEVGYIHITDSTYELVKSDETLHFSHRKTFVKGKGVMMTHLLISAAGSDYPSFDTAESGRFADTSKFAESSTDVFGTSDSFDNSKEGESQGQAEAEKSPSVTKAPLITYEDAPLTISKDDSNWQNLSALHTPSSVATIYSNTYEHARIRKLRISLAVGAMTEEDEGSLIKEQLPVMRNCTMYSVGATSGRSAQSKASRCLSLFRKSSSGVIRNDSFGSNNITNSGSFVYLSNMDDEDDLDEKLDGSDVRMKTSEWLQLKFKDKLQEDRYTSHFYHNRTHINTIEQTLVIFLITFVAQSIQEIAVPRSFVDAEKVERFLYLRYVPYWTVRSVYITLLFFMWLTFHFKSFSQRSESSTTMWFTFLLNLLFVSAACIFALSNSWAVSKSGFYSQYLNLWLPSDSIEFYFYIVVLHHSSGMLFQTCLLVDALFLIISLTFISSSVVQSATTSITIYSIPCYILFNLMSAHCKEAIDRRTFYSNEKARMIEARVGQMLNDMLPRSVLEEFKNDNLKMSYCHEKMAFLFSDIVGFTQWANSVDACEVVALLQKLFARFDRNSTKFGLYKLCTIGDAYVAVSEPATDVPSDQEAIASIEGILQMAYSMIRTIQDVREAFNIPGLNMRIGLHYGSSVGGVIGSGRLRYDLWGMDIQTANAMESHGVPGLICVSERLQLILTTNFPNRFTFSFHQDFNVIDRCVRGFILVSDSNDQTVFEREVTPEEGES